MLLNNGQFLRQEDNSTVQHKVNDVSCPTHEILSKSADDFFEILYTADLIYCCKIVFGLTDLPPSDYFQMAPLLNTRGHKFKLYKKRCSAIVRSKFFSER